MHLKPQAHTSPVRQGIVVVVVVVVVVWIVVVVVVVVVVELVVGIVVEQLSQPEQWCIRKLHFQ